jgi:hypothetical protein
MDQPELYELEFPSPTVELNEGTGPVLVHGLEGFADAGQAVTLATTHLRNSLETQLVASFNVDDLVDYRARRPPMTFRSDHFADYTAPELNLYAVRDIVGTPFLLLAGVEPDFKWEKFTKAVMLLAEQFHVSRSIALSAIPMAVPHTRPLPVTGHGSDRSLIKEEQRLGTDLRVPGSASALLELRMDQDGRTTQGFTVHVPHYLAQSEYAPAAVTLLTNMAQAAGLQLPLAALEQSAREVTEQIAAHIASNPEIGTFVTGLEQQYDTFNAAKQRTSLLAGSDRIPSGDELGAEFERYLAQQNTEDPAPETDGADTPPEASGDTSSEASGDEDTR